VHERVALGWEAVATAERIDDAELTLQGREWLASDLLELGDTTRAGEQMRLHARLAQTLRQPYHQWVTAGMRVTRDHLAGELKRAESLAEQAYVDGVRAHEDDAFQSLSSQLFWIRRDQGRSHELGDLLEEALARFDATAAYWRAVATLHAAETGNLTHAGRTLDHIGMADARGLASIAVDPDWLATVACVAEAAAHVGHRAAAAELYTALEPHAATNVVVAHGRVCLGSAARYLGMLARTTGDRLTAQTHFDHALAFDIALGAPALVARTQHECSRLLLDRDGEPVDAARAVALAEAARHTAARLDLGGLAAAVGRTLAEAFQKRR
jgi:hypothetical protein